MSTSDKPSVSTKAPPQDRKFPCKQCGAKLSFDPASRALSCPYCGFQEKIEPSAGAVEERDFETFLQKQADDQATVDGRSSEVKCEACGAVVLLEDKIVTDRCPFCGTNLTNTPEAASSMIAPESLLPFAITQRQAVQAFNQWVAGRWFAPSTLKQFANLGQLSGIYVPYWTYDSMTFTWYTGQRGDDYTVTETYTETNAQGQTETKTRQVTHTSWTSVSGEVDHFFDDVLICASKSLPDDFVDQLTPWDLKSLEAFNAEFLSGFKTERYAVGLGEGFKKAEAIMDEEIRRLCRRDIGGDHQTLSTVNTQHVGVTFKHILLPVWLAVYRYHDKVYRILINARTGEVVGSRPYSWAKITGLVAAIVLAIVTIILLANH